MEKSFESRTRLKQFSRSSRSFFTAFQNCGEGGIRTLETLASLPVFETGTFNRSATSPNNYSHTVTLFCLFYKKCYSVSRIWILFLIFWPHRLTVRTRPFQGCNRGSIPRGVTNWDLLVPIYIHNEVYKNLFFQEFFIILKILTIEII